MIVASTVITNAQSIQAAGVAQLTKTPANASTSVYILSVQLTPSTVFDPNKRVRIYYTSSPYDLSTAGNAAVASLKGTARFTELQWQDRVSGLALITDTTLEVLTGGYIYVWLDCPDLPAAATVTITLVELS